MVLIKSENKPIESAVLWCFKSGFCSLLFFLAIQLESKVLPNGFCVEAMMALYQLRNVPDRSKDFAPYRWGLQKKIPISKLSVREKRLVRKLKKKSRGNFPLESSLELQKFRETGAIVIELKDGTLRTAFVTSNLDYQIDSHHIWKGFNSIMKGVPGEDVSRVSFFHTHPEIASHSLSPFDIEFIQDFRHDAKKNLGIDADFDIFAIHMQDDQYITGTRSSAH